MVRTIFAQPSAKEVWAQHRRVVDHLFDAGLVDAAEHLDAAGSEILAFTGFPKAHWRQIWSNNPLSSQLRDPQTHQRRRHLPHPTIGRPPRRRPAG